MKMVGLGFHFLISKIMGLGISFGFMGHVGGAGLIWPCGLMWRPHVIFINKLDGVNGWF